MGPAMDVLFGKHGLAWGRGEILGEGTGPVKVERDNRAPAGVFRIGIVYTYDRSLPTGSDYPFHTVKAGDAWVDDTTSPNYNQFVAVDPKNPPAWYDKAKMRLGDFAYRWLVEIRQNADPPVPGLWERHLLPYSPWPDSTLGRLHDHGRAGSGHHCSLATATG